MGNVNRFLVATCFLVYPLPKRNFILPKARERGRVGCGINEANLSSWLFGENI